MSKRIYECEYYKVSAPDKSCLFCKHCTDVFWDFTNGPYLFFCNKRCNTDLGALGKCERFFEAFDGKDPVKDFED